MLFDLSRDAVRDEVDPVLEMKRKAQADAWFSDALNQNWSFGLPSARPASARLTGD